MQPEVDMFLKIIAEKAISKIGEIDNNVELRITIKQLELWLNCLKDICKEEGKRK